MFLISQGEKGYDIKFFGVGLNGAAKNAGFMKSFNDEPKVAIVTPVTSFPIDFFPGLLDAEFRVDAYQGKLRDLKVPSMMFIFNEAQFKKFNEKKGYTKVADFSINQDNFSMIKEYPQV
ncbi:uncharacterized protein LOC124356326 [Homalodisca vitripennis]|uniref:uncharacterized protein LOC124356326 n=1 Tax=Homalodisca vitripennis TaxID=197043 RepID=UPI001EEC7766|nr:uncharacterized protein LOC124356326 [Homalodisca vitripennis]